MRALGRILSPVCALLATACDGGPTPPPPPPSSALAPLVWRDQPATDPPVLQPGVQLADGYVVEGFAAAPLLANPVALDVDARGRVWIAETHRYQRSVLDITQQPAWLSDELALRTVDQRHLFLRRTFDANPELLTADSEILRVLVDADGDGRADRSAVAADGFDEVTAGTAAGVLVVDDDVFFACIPSLWKLDDAARLEHRVTPRSLQRGFGVHVGVTGHDLHGLVLGPDGRLWFTVGDRGASFTTAEGTTIDLPDEGAVYRCELDGSDLEVYARGLRNPQELAFDAVGNLFTCDNDTAGADRSRVIHVVRGADYGWRCSFQHMPGFGPWVQEELWRGSRIDDALPNAGYAPQGPGGLAFHPGTGFDDRERGRFVCCDFPKGVLSFGVEAAGATFQVTDPRWILQGIWAPDACFGPDGALWIVDWIQGWGAPGAGAVHRVFAEGELDGPAVAEVRALLTSDFAERDNDDLITLLGHPDQRVRVRAQRAVAERMTMPAFDAVQDAERRARLLGAMLLQAELKARLPGLGENGRVAAVRALGTAARHRHVLNPPRVEFALADASPSVRAAALQVIADTLGSVGDLDFLGLLRDPDARVRATALQALGGQAAAGGTAERDRLLDLVARWAPTVCGDDPYLEHACVEALRRGLSAEAIARLRDDPSALVRRVAARAARRLADPRVADFLDDPDPDVVSTAVRAIHDVPIDAAMPALADRFDRVPSRDRSRALDALRRLGRPQDIERLAAVAVDAAFDGALRSAALRTLAHWDAPEPIDPVVGLWQPVGEDRPRDLAPVRAALTARIDELFDPATLDSAPSELLQQVVDAMAGLGIAAAVEPLATLAADPDQGETVRAAALRGVLLLPAPATVTERLATLLRSDETPSAVRIAALESVARTGGAPWDDPSGTWVRGRATDPDAPLAERRAALAAWSRLEESTARAALGALLDDGLEPWPPELRLDVWSALDAGADGDEAWRPRVATLRESAGPELFLHGGDPVAGGRIFAEDGRVQCQRCHAVAGVGGNLGPSLDAIGIELSGEQLLQALLEPMARIREGYPPAMPPVAAALAPQELRDLLAWLQARRR